MREGRPVYPRVSDRVAARNDDGGRECGTVTGCVLYGLESYRCIVAWDNPTFVPDAGACVPIDVLTVCE